MRISIPSRRDRGGWMRSLGSTESDPHQVEVVREHECLRGLHDGRARLRPHQGSDRGRDHPGIPLRGRPRSIRAARAGRGRGDDRAPLEHRGADPASRRRRASPPRPVRTERSRNAGRCVLRRAPPAPPRVAARGLVVVDGVGAGARPRPWAYLRSAGSAIVLRAGGAARRARRWSEDARTTAQT